jgi:hypothetical protein
MGRCHDERTDVMSGTFTPKQAGDEAEDLREAGAEPTDAVTATQQGADGLARSFVVTIKTPAGHEHRFRVSGEQRVETVTTRAVAYFVKHGKPAEGKYVLAVMRDGTPEDMTASAPTGSGDASQITSWVESNFTGARRSRASPSTR